MLIPYMLSLGSHWSNGARLSRTSLQYIMADSFALFSSVRLHLVRVYQVLLDYLSPPLHPDNMFNDFHVDCKEWNHASNLVSRISCLSSVTPHSLFHAAFFLSDA